MLELGRGLVQVGVAAGEPYTACCIALHSMIALHCSDASMWHCLSAIESIDLMMSCGDVTCKCTTGVESDDSDCLQTACPSNLITSDRSRVWKVAPYGVFVTATRARAGARWRRACQTHTNADFKASVAQVWTITNI